MKPNKIKISKIKSNPNNPRLIKDYKFRKLVKSIEEFPEMLKLRPIVVDENNIILGGNMRYKACIEAGLKEIYVIQADDLSEDQKKEFIIKDNSSFGDWDWDVIANEWDLDLINDWGVDLPLNDQIDQLEDDDEIELPQSVQLEPPKEYILIMAEPNSVDWEELKETLKLKMVRRGGYKKGSGFDAVSLERVLYWDELKKRINVSSSTK
jgi:ParB-like chromosome segregation protein Spo0J